VPGRLSGVKLGTSGTPADDLEFAYASSNAGRFAGLLAKRDNNTASRQFVYGYETNSSLVKSLSVVGNAFFVTRDFEANRDLMTKVETKWNNTTRTRYDYAYDDRRLRQSVVQQGDVFADYGGTDGGAIHQIFAYNARGEVTAAGTFLGATATDQTTPLAARKHEWDYDGLGNRKWSNTSGVGGTRDQYVTNELNQYVVRENNTLAVGGVADTEAKVAVRFSAVAGRAGKHWGDNLTLDNWAYPFKGNITIYAVNSSANTKEIMTRTAFLPPAAQTFAYDADGNITNDGVWTYVWDAENRLTAMETTAGAVMGGMTAQKLEFKYDYMHRRAEKLVRGGWNGTSYTTVTSQRRYLYDGWSLLAEFSVNGSSLTKVRTYAWGLDIARSMKDAGGVGALLQIRDHASGKDYFPSYDGNGNIAALLDADSSTGAVAAAYEYSPYGEFLRCEGSYAKENPFRFSTKPLPARPPRKSSFLPATRTFPTLPDRFRLSDPYTIVRGMVAYEFKAGKTKHQISLNVENALDDDYVTEGGILSEPLIARLTYSLSW
jgi:YD repeat-containing protein